MEQNKEGLGLLGGEKMEYQDLKDYLGMKSEVQAILEEINYWQTFVLTVKYDSNGSKSGTPSDPTRKSALKLLELDEKLKKKRDKLVKKTLEIEEWLETLEDLVLVAVIRQHFILGKTWRETSKIVFEVEDPSISHKKVVRFFE